MYYRKLHTQEQSGIVSILVTMIIMMVLTLIVVGFAQLARREQRESLDRQLSTQAFYAAESGVNDARRAMNKAVNPFKGEKNTCGPITSATSPGYPELSKNVLSSDGVISYSCLLITRRLENIIYQIPTNSTKVIPFNAVSAASGSPDVVNRIAIRWTKQDGTVNLPGSVPPTLPPAGGGAGQWGTNAVALMRADIIPTSGVLSPDALTANTLTVFFYPIGGAGSVASKSDNGKIVGANCANVCNGVVNASSLSASTSYVVRLKPIYQSATVKICLNDCNGVTLIEGPQAEVDSTGKANDVLKRIKVRIDDTSSTSKMKEFPDEVLNSKDSICKKLEVYPGDANFGGCTL